VTTETGYRYFLRSRERSRERLLQFDVDRFSDFCGAWTETAPGSKCVRNQPKDWRHRGPLCQVGRSLDGDHSFLVASDPQDPAFAFGEDELNVGPQSWLAARLVRMSWPLLGVRPHTSPEGWAALLYLESTAAGRPRGRQSSRLDCAEVEVLLVFQPTGPE
jgi:hypothetical protein